MAPADADEAVMTEAEKQMRVKASMKQLASAKADPFSAVEMMKMSARMGVIAKEATVARVSAATAAGT